MASTSKIHSKNFNDNNSFKVNTLSTLLSGIKTEANTGLILTTYTTQTLSVTALIRVAYSGVRLCLGACT
jgi:hypothetical protein